MANVVAGVLASLLYTMMYSVQLFCIFCMLLILQGIFVDELMRMILRISNMELVFVECFGNMLFVCLNEHIKLYSNLCYLI